MILLPASAPAADGARREDAQKAAPFTVAEGLFDHAQADLGLRRAAGARTATIFRPGKADDKFSNGVVLMPFRGRLYAQWQQSARDEDSPDTRVAYASSANGTSWSSPRTLAPAGTGGLMRSSGGWWTDGSTLVAFVNVWPTGFQSGDGGFTEYLLSTDGKQWSQPKRVMMKDGAPVEGIIEQDPHATRTGRIVTAFHTRPGMIVAQFYTDDALGISGWVRGHFVNLAHGGRVSRELEPAWFERANCLVMVFRDQAESFRQLAAESCDQGVSWSNAALTGMPDSRAKQSAGNLPGGTAFLVNAPNDDKVRIPLAITLSSDGRNFDRAFLLRGSADLQPLRYAGQYKRPGYHYPKSVVWKDHLYVAYATNKEDVELTRIPLTSLAPR